MTSDTNIQMLLIGEPSKAFVDKDALGRLPCRICTNAAEGLDVARSGGFDVVAVVISGVRSGLESILRTLRWVSPRARIVLLAQMYEEPVAMQLVASHGGLADDYLICPLDAARVCELVAGPRVIGVRSASAAPTAPPALAPEVAERIRHLEKLATEDDLTGLKNRRYIMEFAGQIIEHAGAGGGQVTLLLFDVDNLKSYNDTYGHLAGDEVLKQAAVLMRRCCRRHDVVGRIGGDEFAVVFWDAPLVRSGAAKSERRTAAGEHPKEAISVAKRFRAELEKTELPGVSPKAKGILTISGGLASLPHDGSTVEELFRQADKALLEAKRGGKNKIYLVGEPKGDIANIE